MSSAAPRITGFDLGEEIGQGAMSIVYSATRAGQRFAVKVMKPGAAEGGVDAGLRFRRLELLHPD